MDIQASTLSLNSSVVMPVWVRASTRNNPSWRSPASRVATSPFNAACTIGSAASAGSEGARRLTSSNANATWNGTGASVHSVPSLSNTAMGSASATKSAVSGVVTRSTKSTIDCLAGVSFQDESGSVAAAVSGSDVHPVTDQAGHQNRRDGSHRSRLLCCQHRGRPEDTWVSFRS